jgi:hypothetical protein
LKNKTEYYIDLLKKKQKERKKNDRRILNDNSSKDATIKIKKNFYLKKIIIPKNLIFL